MLQIGWATRDFTPDRPAMLQGQRHRRITSEVMDPLTVTALALAGGAPPDCAILISCAVPFIHDTLLAGVRHRLKRALPDFPVDRVVMTATHTHTSLVTKAGFYEPPGDGVMTPAECEALVADRAADAAVEAWQSRAPQLLGRAFGHAVVGHNRHAVYADGHAQMYGKTAHKDFCWIGGYEDHSVDMLFTWNPDGALTGVALAIPCPSQVDERLNVISADYWHEVRQELRARFGAGLFVLPLCAPAGDQSPHFLLYDKEEKEMRERRGVTERQEIAQRVADAVARALACTPPPKTDGPIVFSHVVERLALTPRRVLKHERDWAEAERNRWAKEKGETTSWWPENLQRVVQTGDGTLKPDPFPVELHTLRIGDVALATNPFELFVDYAMQIKARSAAAQTILVQLTTGMGWYLPTERAVQGGGYGAMPAVSRVGPEGGRELVEKTIATIQKLW